MIQWRNVLRTTKKAQKKYFSLLYHFCSYLSLSLSLSLSLYIYIYLSAQAGCDPRTILTVVFFLLARLSYQGWRGLSTLLFTHSRREKDWIHTFSIVISAMWNAVSTKI